MFDQAQAALSATSSATSVVAADDLDDASAIGQC
jgi:hypothetical protein